MTDTNTKDDPTDNTDAPFIPSETFAGARDGYAFTRGAEGVGYYLETDLAAEAVVAELEGALFNRPPLTQVMAIIFGMKDKFRWEIDWKEIMEKLGKCGNDNAELLGKYYKITFSYPIVDFHQYSSADPEAEHPFSSLMIRISDPITMIFKISPTKYDRMRNACNGCEYSPHPNYRAKKVAHSAIQITREYFEPDQQSMLESLIEETTIRLNHTAVKSTGKCLTILKIEPIE